MRAVTLATVAALIALVATPTPSAAAVRPDASMEERSTFTKDQERRIRVQLRRDVELRVRESKQGILTRQDFEHIKLRFEMFDKQR